MGLAYFEYKGKKSIDFGIMISEELKHESPGYDVEFIKIDGVDGEYAMKDATLKNYSKNFPIILEDTSQGVINSISDWLKGTIAWYELTLSYDPNYIYIAMFNDEYQLGNNSIDYEKSILPFTCKPLKYLKSSMNETTLGSSINNPTSRTAKPKLIIKGSGNITVKIGSSELTLKNVDGGVIVDSQAQTITDLTGKRSQFNKMTSYPFIQIKPGHNTVLKTGTITSVSIVPRFEVIAT